MLFKLAVDTGMVLFMVMVFMILLDQGVTMPASLLQRFDAHQAMVNLSDGNTSA